MFDHFQFALIHGPNIPGSYAILFFTTLDLTSITSHIHNWVLFLFWLCLFILSGVICPRISSSILDTHQPEEFIFQCPIFLPFQAVNCVLKARNLMWFAIPFPVDHILSELSTMTHPSWVALHGMAHSFIELDQAVGHVNYHMIQQSHSWAYTWKKKKKQTTIQKDMCTLMFTVTLFIIVMHRNK